MLRRTLALALTAALLGGSTTGCSSVDTTPEDATPMQDRAAPAPESTPPTAMTDAPPLGRTRPKIAPDSVVPDAGDRATIR